ncbi:ATP-dependent DNA helicase RRM3-like protein [Tanacetum coccineum]
MQGPCGADNPSCPCTVDYKCTKKFPKQFNESTVIDDNGYAIYKRRNYGSAIKKSGTDLHNGYVVPYNPGLLRRYQAHINVKYCNQVGSIKYLFKYINKGPDRVSVTIDGKEVNEIKDYLNCKYLSACDAVWRIYGFDIHYRTLSVERLPFCLKDEQQVIFDATESINYAVDKSSVNETKFESWMELNKTDPFVRSLLYVEIPRYYVWNQKRGIWTLGKQGKSLGRIHHVPTSWGELYYLRTILNKVRGPMEWGDLKKVGDVLYPTYKDACYARGLLQDDKEYIDGILEASFWGMRDYLRSIFVMLIMTDSLELSDIQRKNICLTYIECMLWSNNRSLKDIQNMPYPDREYMMDGYNRLIFDETSYDPYKLKEQHVKLYGSLTSEQKDIYSTVMDAVDNDKGGMFFVYGYGSTGKTYLYKTMSVALRSKGEIVLNVASSGIATLLLEGGRTAHSRFAIPINVVEDLMCHIGVDSDLADLIRQEKLIIWDEAPMVNRHCYEAFDRTLHDICRTYPIVASNKTGCGKCHDKCFVFVAKMHCFEANSNGKVGGANDGVSTIVFPDNMLIPETDDDIEYESSDSVCLANDDSNFDDSIYTTEFLNGIRMSDIPHHSIKLKIGTPIMLMRNIDQRAGLCNGTRLQVLRMGDNIIEAKIISGGSVGTICAIPRMIISPTDTKMPFKLNRRQFPIQVYFL